MENRSSSSKKLIQALIVSGCLNFLLVALLCYILFKERPPIPYYAHKPVEDTSSQHQNNHISNASVINEFKEMSVEQLVAKLSNTQLVENGYTQRDLALGCLITFHHFNLQRALLGLPYPDQKRIFTGFSPRQEKFDVVVLSGVSENQYQSILQYAQREKWPFTSQGLFLMLKNPQFTDDSSLKEAFFMTPEFLAVEMLFNRSDAQMDKQLFLNILKEGNWETLHAFSEKQRMSQDLSGEQRAKFLADYMKLNSKIAAYTLLKFEPGYALKKLDDQGVILMMRLMDNKTVEAEKFAKAMLVSPRSDAVWQEAALRLYSYAGEAAPLQNHRSTALARFMPQALGITKHTPPQQPAPKKEIRPVIKTEPAKGHVAKKEIKPPQPPAKITAQVTKKKPDPVAVLKPQPQKKDRLYIVQQGDSLWKISKRFNVDVELLRKHNRLSNDALQPGTALRIP